MNPTAEVQTVSFPRFVAAVQMLQEAEALLADAERVPIADRMWLRRRAALLRAMALDTESV
jgi:head-tail adaptor